ncbi:hypothetical protein BU17DRAFT_69223 [Hysterangium stoloniferum]|nr:hypothetical protein BU17DRAFT_69223 [Hysterangium stoloniferum]
MSYNAAQIASFVQAESDNQFIYSFIIAGSGIPVYLERKIAGCELSICGGSAIYASLSNSLPHLGPHWIVGRGTKPIKKRKWTLLGIELMFPQTTMLGKCDSSFRKPITLRSLTEMTGGKSLSSLILKQATPLGLNNVQDNIFMDTSRYNNRQSSSSKTVNYSSFWKILKFQSLAFVSVILDLRFFLDLRDRNAHQNGTSQTRDEALCSSFKAAAQKFSNAIVDDLGDPDDEQFVGSQATSSGTVSGRVLRPAASDAENNDSSPAVNLEVFS